MKKHFVTFFSPGTFLSEETTKHIDSWDITQAINMVSSIKERCGATPYGFQFSTRKRKDDELDSYTTKKSGMYFLGGEILTLNTIKKLNNPEDKILISNMESNRFDKVIINTNSWKITLPFTKKDVLLNYTPST